MTSTRNARAPLQRWKNHSPLGRYARQSKYSRQAAQLTQISPSSKKANLFRAQPFALFPYISKRHSLFDEESKDRPGGSPARDFLEARLLERGGGPGVDKGSGHIFLSIHRITLHDLSALFADVLHRGLQQLDGDPLPSKFLRHKETGDRPDRLVIDRLEACANAPAWGRRRAARPRSIPQHPRADKPAAR